MNTAQTLNNKEVDFSSEIFFSITDKKELFLKETKSLQRVSGF